MLPTQTTRPERQVRADETPEGALMMTSSGFLAIRTGGISIQLVGDNSPRLVHDVGMYGSWSILSSDEHELELPEEAFTLTDRPDVKKDLAGVDANGRGVEWLETNRIDHWNNTWEWFTFKSEEPLTVEEVAYPIRAWVI